MAGTKQLRAWFTAITTDISRLRKSDKPTQQTFENLISSTAFLTESSDRAKVSTGATLASEQGLVVLASDVQARAGTSQLSDRSLVIQPSQLPTLSSLDVFSVQDMPTTTIDISLSSATTRNAYRTFLNSTWITWLISRIFKQGGTIGQVPIKVDSTNYNWNWGQLGNNTTFINALTNDSNFTTALQTTITNIITSTPTYFSDSLEVGFMRVYPSITLPSAKWLRCDGSAISRTTYSTLFTLIGTTYGTGDGSTTFNIPDLRDRQTTGYSGSKTIGSIGGAESHTIIINNLPPHTHDVGTLGGTTNTTGDHNHSFSIHNDGSSPQSQANAAGNSNPMADANTNNAGNHSHTLTITGNTGDGGFGSTPMDTKDPYLALNVIIKITL